MSKRGNIIVISFTRTRFINIVELIIKLELLNRVKGLPSVSAGL